MNISQTLRRIGQMPAMKKWAESGNELNAQLPLLTKLYANHGLRLELTCGACPEQYEVFDQDVQVGYIRLRHGEMRVDYPDCGGMTIFEEYPNGDGCFEPNERLVFMTHAMRAILKTRNQIDQYLNPQP